MKDDEQNEHKLLKLSREQLLVQTREALRSYKNENAQHIERNPFAKFPYDISDMLDLIFLRTWRPVHGLFPSSHYIVHVDTCIDGISEKLALFEKRKPVVDKTITELSDKFKLSDDERTALLNKCYLGLDSDPEPEVIAQSALAIMADKDKMTESVANNALGIFLLEKALEIASTRAEEDYIPKRYALVLAEIYSNSRDEVIDKVPFNEKLALKYLTLAKEHGSNTAAGLLDEENPIKALCKSNGVDYSSIKASSGCLARSNDTLFSTSTDGKKDERPSSGLDDDMGPR